MSCTFTFCFFFFVLVQQGGTGTEDSQRLIGPLHGRDTHHSASQTHYNKERNYGQLNFHIHTCTYTTHSHNSFTYTQLANSFKYSRAISHPSNNVHASCPSFSSSSRTTASVCISAIVLGLRNRTNAFVELIVSKSRGTRFRFLIGISSKYCKKNRIH